RECYSTPYLRPLISSVRPLLIFQFSPYTTLFRSPNLGVTPIEVDMHQLDEVEELLKSEDQIKMVYMETPANPTLRCIDLQRVVRSEEHTSELQSRFDLVCRLLLEQRN